MRNLRLHHGAVVTLASLLAMTAFAPSAQAADPTAAECIAANDSATKLRGQGKLLDARQAFATCAAPTCPATIRGECQKQVDAVNAALPTVDFEPKDASGNDVVTPVKVSMDGKPLVDKLEGRAIEVDPGPHEFAFEAAGMAPAKKTLMIHEGEKDRREAIVLAAAAPGAAPAAAGLPAQSAPAGPVAPSTAGSAAAPAAASAPADAAAALTGAIEVGARIGYSIPMGNATGAPGDSLSNWVSNRIPFWFDLGYRISPAIMFGAFFQYAIGSLNTNGPVFNGCLNSAISCSGNDVEFGAQVQYHVRPEFKFDPWLGLGAGYEILTASYSGAGQSGSASLNGFQFLNLMAGADYKAMPSLGIGPFLSFSLSQYSNCSQSGAGSTGGNCSIAQQALHEWFTFGVRGAYDIGLQ